MVSWALVVPAGCSLAGTHGLSGLAVLTFWFGLRERSLTAVSSSGDFPAVVLSMSFWRLAGTCVRCSKRCLISPIVWFSATSARMISWPDHLNIMEMHPSPDDGKIVCELGRTGQQITQYGQQI